MVISMLLLMYIIELMKSPFREKGILHTRKRNYIQGKLILHTRKVLIPRTRKRGKKGGIRCYAECSN